MGMGVDRQTVLDLAVSSLTCCILWPCEDLVSPSFETNCHAFELL
jgi:hypothetical protein